MDRLTEIYKAKRTEIGNDLQIKNVMAIPKIEKVTLNIGLNMARTDSKKIERMTKVMAQIAGQKPSIRRARKAISSFKLRAGEPVGLSLTLRGQRMYDFLERFIRIVLPRVRDFRGISTTHFDGRGNLSIGIREMSIFPEISYEDIDVLHGLEITITTTAKDNAGGERLLKELGMPLIDKR